MPQRIELTSPARLDRNDLIIALAIFALALLVRLLFLYSSPDRSWPHSMFYEGDAPTWIAWAQALQAGQPFEFNLPLRAPAVAYLLHWFSSGNLAAPFTAFKVLWCVFTALACSIVYLACLLNFTRRVALTAAALSVFSFGSYVISTSLNNEAPYELALFALALLTMIFARRPTFWLAAILGAMHGIAMLIRFEHQLLLMMMIVYLAYQFWLNRGHRLTSPIAGHNKSPAISSIAPFPLRGFAMIAVLAVTAIAVVTPWSIHGSLATQRFNTVTPAPPNYQSCRLNWHADAREMIASLPAFSQDGTVKSIDFIGLQTGLRDVTRSDVVAILNKYFGYVHEPLSSWTLLSIKGPLDFALANHPESKGEFSKAALQSPGETQPPTIAFGRPDHLRLFNHGYAIGWGYISADFPAWLKRVQLKLQRFFDGVTLGFTAINWPGGLTGERPPVDVFINDASNHSLISFVWRSIVMLVIIGGVLVIPYQRRGGIWLLIIAYKLIVTILFYGYARQAVSILPAFYVLIALALNQIVIWSQLDVKLSSRFKTILLVGALAVTMGAEIYSAVARPELKVTGNIHPTPQWGPEAFESIDRLGIAPIQKR